MTIQKEQQTSENGATSVQATLIDTPNAPPKTKKAAPRAAGAKKGSKEPVKSAKPATAPTRDNAPAYNDKPGITMESLLTLIEHRIQTALDRVEKPTEKPSLIFSAMRNIMRDIVPLAKRHEHDSEGFMFRRIDEVASLIQPLLVKHGVFYTPEVLSKVEVERKVINANGETWVNIFSTITVAWHIRSTIDGSKWPDPCVTIGEGMSEMHFSTNAGFTMAEKAMLTKIFCIPVFGEDPEEITGERSQASTPQMFYVQPESRGSVPVPTTPSLFDDELPEATPFNPTTETKTKRRGKTKEPQMSSVGGAPLPDQATAAEELPAEVRHEPLTAGFISILKTNLRAKKISEEALFDHFKIEHRNSPYSDWPQADADAAWASISKSQMDEAMAFIAKGPQS